MIEKRLIQHLYPTYLLIMVLALGAFGWYAMASLKDFLFARTASELAARAGFTEVLMQGRWSEDPAEVDRICKRLGKRTNTRITLILPDGVVLGDSDEDPRKMENHARRPEVQAVLHGEVGRSLRFSRTLQKKMMYRAEAVREEGRLVGVVRTAIPVTTLEYLVASVKYRIFVGIILIGLLSAGVGLIIYRRLSRPLIEMREGAEQFARGELDYRLPIPDSGHLGSLAVALNRMAGQLKERIDTIVRQRNEQEALLSGMMEGVIAIDMERRILSMNRAAAALFGVHAGEVRGKRLAEISRAIDLQEFVEKVIVGGETVEEELAIFAGGEQYLQAHGTLLKDSEFRRIGALVVLNDITRIKRLEKVRRDFFDNVSHELRTPLTSITGYVETLRDGAMDRPKDAARFLEVIHRQSNRLLAIIEDLLALSRIEQGTERGSIEFEETDINALVERAIQLLEKMAGEKKITIDQSFEPDLSARVNGRLLEQAVQNLLNNAVKFSSEGKTVRVTTVKEEERFLIRVTDEGPGIPREYLPRLFERFYRIDRDRNREMGGTGLGLAIVKHIAQAHRGVVTVESTPGRGSTFTICLPLA